MKKTSLLLASLGFALIAFAPLASTAHATDLFEGIPCNQLSEEQRRQTPACTDASDQDPIIGSDGVISRITNLLAVIAGILAVIIIVWGGFTYITSDGDATKATNARNTIVYAAVGLVVIVLAQAFIALILSSL